jgi:hypothetical protein
VTGQRKIPVELLMDIVGYREDGQTEYADRSELAIAQGLTLDRIGRPMGGSVVAELPETEVARLEPLGAVRRVGAV